MKLSYIITTFNRHALLERAIGYVARERCAESELIVVDDNSQVPVVMPDLASQAFPYAHRLIRNSSNLGVIGARNMGIAAARGEYLIFLDDDDESLPNRTNALLAKIDNSDFDFVTAQSFMQSGAGEKTVPSEGGFLLSASKLLLHPSHIDAIIWRKKMFKGTEGLDSRVPYLGEHISLVLCLLHAGNGYLLDTVVARFGYIEAGLTQQTQQQNTLKNHLLEMYQILLEESETPEFRQLCDKVLRMLQKENVFNFDDYLKHLQLIMRKHR